MSHKVDHTVLDSSYEETGTGTFPSLVFLGLEITFLSSQSVSGLEVGQRTSTRSQDHRLFITTTIGQQYRDELQEKKFSIQAREKKKIPSVFCLIREHEDEGDTLSTGEKLCILF